MDTAKSLAVRMAFDRGIPRLRRKGDTPGGSICPVIAYGASQQLTWEFAALLLDWPAQQRQDIATGHDDGRKTGEGFHLYQAGRLSAGNIQMRRRLASLFPSVIQLAGRLALTTASCKSQSLIDICDASCMLTLGDLRLGMHSSTVLHMIRSLQHRPSKLENVARGINIEKRKTSNPKYMVQGCVCSFVSETKVEHADGGGLG